MEKLKKNAGFKAAVAIVLIVSLVATVASGLLGIVLFREDAFNPGGSERVKKDIIEGISWQYEQDAILYYRDYINGFITTDYEENFKEENCNYAFTITPKDSAYPSLSNYVPEYYQYKKTSSEVVWGGEDYTKKFSYHMDKKDIIQNMKYRLKDSCFEDDYSDSEIAYLSDDGSCLVEDAPSLEYLMNNCGETEDGSICYDDFYVTVYYDERFDAFLACLNNEYYMVLNEEKGFFNRLEANKKQDASMSYTFDAYYNDALDNVVVTIMGSQYVDVILTSYVKTDITAHDNYYSSFYLKYMDDAINATIPVFVVSVILDILCIAFLTASCGKRKGKEEVTYNWFDQIPFDLLGMISILLPVAAYDFILYGGMQYSYMLQFFVLFCFVLLISTEAVCLYMTLVARIRAKGWGFVKDCVVTRILAWSIRLIKKFFRLFGNGCSYLWKHFHIYGKYLGVYLAVNFVTIILGIGAESVGFMAALLFFETILFGFVLMVALVNMKKLKDGVKKIANGEPDQKIDTTKMLWEFREHGEDLNHIGNGIQNAVKNQMKSERMKTELITNVSHDIKTPLTSIISYVDLLKKEPLGSEKAGEYIDVLDRQSVRLKKLIQDLLDASKASTGNIDIKLEEIDVRVTLDQALGEFADRLEEKKLKTVVNYNIEENIVMADGKLLWRVFDNLITNISKYAMENSRVYIDITEKKNILILEFKNISAEPLNISGDELMERFVRGDKSRNTEGSGLGLSIAKSLMELMGGSMKILVDGDLFKVILELPM